MFRRLKNSKFLSNKRRARREASRRRTWGVNHIEWLEERALFACDLYTTAAAKLQEQIDAMQIVVGVAVDIGQEIPFVGTKLASVGDAFDKFAPQLVQKITDASEDLGEAGLRAALFELLNPEDGVLPLLGDRDGNGTVNSNDIHVDGDLSDVNCHVTVSMRLTQELAEVTLPDFKFDVGLGALPFDVKSSGGVKLKFGFDYHDLQFTLSTANGANIDTSMANELTLSVTAEFAPDTQLTADVGFLHATVTDGVTNANGSTAKSSMTAGIQIDIGQNAGGFTATASFDTSADLNLHLHAEVDANFPSVDTDFVMKWNGFEANDAAPTVAFKNISVNMGEFMSELLRPVVDVVQKTAEPILPIIEFVTEPIPVLSDLSNAIGTGDVSILTLAGIAGNQLPEGFKELVEVAEVVIQVLDIVNMFETLPSGDVLFNVGDVDLSGNGDLRNAPKAKKLTDVTEKDLTNLLLNKSKVADLKEKVEDSDLPDELKQPLLSVLDRFASGVSFEFPFLKDPTGALGGLLVGKDATLFKLLVNYQIDSSMDITAPIPIGIDVGIAGVYDLDATIEIGYDTFGLRKFIAKGEASGGYDGDDLLDGLYIKNGSHIFLDGGIEAKVGVDYIVFEASVSGGLLGGIHVSTPSDFAPPGDFADNDDDRIRPFSEIGPCLFAADGNLNAELNAKVRVGTDFLGFEETFNLAKANLLDFDIPCVGNPFYEPPTPNLAVFDPDTGVLTLNTMLAPNIAQPGMPLRVPQPKEINEVYKLTPGLPKPGDPQVAGDIVIVSAFGLKERFVGVTKIVAKGGSGNDSIKILKSNTNGATITADVQISGGDGNDKIVYEGVGTALLSGDKGDDLLVGGDGPQNWIFGGAGNDQLRGGGGENLLNGGQQDDVLVGGSGHNEMGIVVYEGALLTEPGHDQLHGGLGANVMRGGTGNDKLFAGPKNDFLDGGDGQDLLVAGSGRANFQGRRGDDQIIWHVGDGIPLAIDGGEEFRETNTLALVGTADVENLLLSKDLSSSRVQIQGLTKNAFLASDVHHLSFEGNEGQDQVIVAPLGGTPVREVGIHLGDVLKDDKGLGDGVPDKVFIAGTMNDDTVTIETEIAMIQKPVFVDDRPVVAGKLGGIMKITGLPSYTVRVANVEDDLTVATLRGADVVNVKSITGPTQVLTSEGDDVINVLAKKTGNPDDPTDLPDYMAELKIDAGSDRNRLNVDQSASLIAATVDVTSNRISSELLPGVNFTASGGNFQGGIRVASGDFADTIRVQETLPEVITVIETGGGHDLVQVGSNVPNVHSDLTSIAGPLVVDGGADSNVLALNDFEATSGNQQVMIQPGVVLGFAGPSDEIPIFYAASGQLQLALLGSDHVSEKFTLVNPNAAVSILAGGGDDQVLVAGLSRPAGVLGGTGDDRVTLGAGVNKLDSIAGQFIFIGQDGQDHLDVLDSENGAGQSYKLGTTTLERAGAVTVTFNDTLESLNLLADDLDDGLQVTGVPTATTVNVELGAGVDVLTGPDTNNLWKVAASNGQLNTRIHYSSAEKLVGGAQSDLFRIANVAGSTGEIQGGGGTDRLDYSTFLTPIQVNIQSHTATRVGKWGAIEAVVGGAAADTLVGPNLPNGWLVRSANGGRISTLAFWNIHFGSIEHLVGGTSLDSFQFLATGSLAGTISDKGGTADQLDYSPLAAGVRVNLQTGAASKVLKGVAGIERVLGSAGDDVLMGNGAANRLDGGDGHDVLVGAAGNDTLLGGLGRDLLIGGLGSDSVVGGDGDDLIIGNSTSFDANATALLSLLDEWASGNSLAVRVDHLRHGGAGALNGSNVLDTNTVTNDLAADVLTGGEDDDWFWATLDGPIDQQDDMTDLAPEVIN